MLALSSAHALQTGWELVPVTEDLKQPLAIRFLESSGQAFVAQRTGEVVRIDLGTQETVETVLDIADEVSLSRDGGLLGIEFDSRTKQLFFQYTREPEPGVIETVLERLFLAEEPPLRQPIFAVSQVDGRHNGSDLHFGPDGMLYVALGDGGGRNDPENNGQDVSTVSGAILRIDPYAPDTRGAKACALTNSAAIPDDNPFVATPGACPEIWAYGLRSPWRFSFDRTTLSMYIGDVGQEAYEEIHELPYGISGANLGWRCMEGNADAPGALDCNPPEHVPPILSLAHQNQPCDSIIGGYRYRGRMAFLWGVYVFGDFCTGQIYTATRYPDGWQLSNIIPLELPPFSLVSFGENADGDLFVVDINGTVFLLTNSEALFSNGFEP